MSRSLLPIPSEQQQWRGRRVQWRQRGGGAASSSPTGVWGGRCIEGARADLSEPSLDCRCIVPLFLPQVKVALSRTVWLVERWLLSGSNVGVRVRALSDGTGLVVTSSRYRQLLLWMNSARLEDPGRSKGIALAPRRPNPAAMGWSGRSLARRVGRPSASGSGTAAPFPAQGGSTGPLAQTFLESVPYGYFNFRVNVKTGGVHCF